MKHRVSKIACERQSSKENIVEIPTKDMIAKYIQYGGHEPFLLAAILTCPEGED